MSFGRTLRRGFAVALVALLCVGQLALSWGDSRCGDQCRGKCHADCCELLADQPEAASCCANSQNDQADGPRVRRSCDCGHGSTLIATAIGSWLPPQPLRLVADADEFDAQAPSLRTAEYDDRRPEPRAPPPRA